MIPQWLYERARPLAIFAALLLLASAISSAWDGLGLPRPVLSGELHMVEQRVAALERFNADTRVLVLDQQWWRNKARLEDLGEPSDASSRELRRRLQQEQASLERLIQELRSFPKE